MALVVKRKKGQSQQQMIGEFKRLTSTILVWKRSKRPPSRDMLASHDVNMRKRKSYRKNLIS